MTTKAEQPEAVILLTDCGYGRAGARVSWAEPWKMRELVAQGMARWDRPFDQVKTGRRQATQRTKG